MSEFERMKKETEDQSNFLTQNVLDVVGINRKPTSFDPKRYVHLKQVVQKLSRDKRSVKMIDHLLAQIFVTEDAECLQHDPQSQLKCIHMKFVICSDLAKSCKLSMQTILKYASHQVFGLITYLVILNCHTINLLEEFVTLQFFTDFILHKSWFYLLKQELINFDTLQNNILSIKQMHSKESYYTLDNLKKNLPALFAKIALSQKLTTPQRKQMLQKVKLTFNFESDQEMVELYNSKLAIKGNGAAFETIVLCKMMESMGIKRQYFIEKELMESEAEKTLQYYVVDNLLNENFYGKSTPAEANKSNKFSNGLEFLNKDIKKEASLNSSDFAVCFLDAFHYSFPRFLGDKVPTLDRQTCLWSFIRTVELLLKKSIFLEETFRQAMIMKSVFVLRLAIASKDTVDMGIFSLANILNAIGLKQVTSFLNYFFAIVVHAFLNFPERKKIKKYTAKIFEFYIKEKKSWTMARFKEIQFVLLSGLGREKRIAEVVTLISNELYATKDDIATNLKEHVLSLRKANEDIRILGVRYILELLETKQAGEIRAVLVGKEVLRVVYSSILDLKQAYKSNANQTLAVLCAKCIAAIGLCHSFVNDPVLLKATNQQTQITNGLQDAGDMVEGGVPNVIKSDHYNPITQMKYKEQKRDNTLELLAIPTFNNMPIERVEFTDFAKSLVEIVSNMALTTEERPKNFFFTQFLLTRFIKNQDDDNGNKPKEQQRGDNLIKEPNQLDQATESVKFKQELLAKSIKRFDGFNLESCKKLPPYNQTTNLRRFVLYLIAVIEDKRWQSLFESCVPLLKRSDDFLHVLLPYIVYYALRFGTPGNALPQELAGFLNDVLDSEMQSEINPILGMFDFLSIAREQDKHMFKEYIESETRFKYVEKLFFLDLDLNNKDANIVSFVKIVNQSQKIKASFLVVKKINELFLKLDRSKKAKGANSVKNYKRCVFNVEDYFRATVNQNTNHGKGFLDILQPEENIEVVKLHKNLNPEDFDSPLFNNTS